MSQSVNENHFDLSQYLLQCLTDNLSNQTLRQRIKNDIQSTNDQIRERLAQSDIDFDGLATDYKRVGQLYSDLKASEQQLNEFIESDLITKIADLTDLWRRSNQRLLRSQRLLEFIDQFKGMREQMSSLDQSLSVNDYDSSVQYMNSASHLYQQLIAAIEDNDDLKSISIDLRTYLDSFSVDLTIKREEMIFKTKQLFNTNVNVFRDEFNNENVFEYKLIKNLKRSEYQNFVKTFVGIEEKSFILKNLVKKLDLFFIKPILNEEIIDFESKDNRIVAKFGKNISRSPIATLKEFFALFYNLVTNDNEMQISGQMIGCLGQIWTEGLFGQILNNYFNRLMPKNELEIDSFLAVVDSAEDLRKFLIEIGLIDETESSPFIEFAVNINAHFCRRLSTDFLITGKTIICRDLHQTVRIGTEGSADDQTLPTGDQLRDHESDHIGKLSACRVSQSMLDLKQLYQQILDLSDRCSDDCSKALIETMANICELYIDISPIYHRKMITEFPQQNAIFHNNCMFFGNLIETFGQKRKSLAVVRQYSSIVKELGSLLFLRQMQSQEKLLLDLVQNQQFSHCINELSTEDSKSSYGDQLAKELRHVLRQCLVHLNFLKNALSDVLPLKIYEKAIATIINSLFTDLINKIIIQNDISSSGASRLSAEIDFLLNEVKAFFRDDNPMRFVQKWSKLSNLNFILNVRIDCLERF